MNHLLWSDHYHIAIIEDKTKAGNLLNMIELSFELFFRKLSYWSEPKNQKLTVFLVLGWSPRPHGHWELFRSQIGSLFRTPWIIEILSNFFDAHSSFVVYVFCYFAKFTQKQDLFATGFKTCGNGSSVFLENSFLIKLELWGLSRAKTRLRWHLCCQGFTNRQTVRQSQRDTNSSIKSFV